MEVIANLLCPLLLKLESARVWPSCLKCFGGFFWYKLGRKWWQGGTEGNCGYQKSLCEQFCFQKDQDFFLVSEISAA